MALQRILVTDFSFGQVSKRYAGRIAQELRTRALEHINGFVLQADGGVGRRKGSVYVRDGVGITPRTHKLYDSDGVPAFEIFRDGDQRWIGYVQESPKAWVAHKLDGTATLTITDSVLGHGLALHSTDTFLDPETTAEYIHLWTSDDAFSMTVTTAGAAGLLRTAGHDVAVVHQNRKIVVDRELGTIRMSKVMSLFDFTEGDQDADAISGTPDFGGIERAQWLKARQSVYLGTDRAEYEMYSSFPYFSADLGGLMVRKITDIGTENAEYFGPMMTAQAIAGIMGMQYTGQAFDYQVASLTDRIDNNRLMHLQTAEYGTHRYLLALDVDGILWAFLLAPSANVGGWFQLADDVGWMAAHGKDIYVALERDGAYSVEVLPLDALQHPSTRTPRQVAMFLANDAHGDRGGFLTLTSTTLTGDTLPPSETVSLYDIDVAARTSEYVADVATDASGDLALTVAQVQSLVGWTSGESYLYAHEQALYPAGLLRTLPLGGLIGSKDRIASVLLQVVGSSGARVRVNDGGWEEHTTDVPESGVWKFRVSHAQTEEARIEIATVDQRPLSVYQVLVEVDAGGL